MNLIVLQIVIFFLVAAFAGLIPVQRQVKRDFMSLETIATLTVGSCPSGPVTISKYPSVACPENFDTSDDVTVLFTCSSNSGSSPPTSTLTLYNAFNKTTGAGYSDAYIITGYAFSNAIVTSGPVSFYSLSLNCTSPSDYCGVTQSTFITNCSTTTRSSSSSTESIYVLPSGESVDFCRGGGSSCCSAVNATNCAPVESYLFFSNGGNDLDCSPASNYQATCAPSFTFDSASKACYDPNPVQWEILPPCTAGQSIPSGTLVGMVIPVHICQGSTFVSMQFTISPGAGCGYQSTTLYNVTITPTNISQSFGSFTGYGGPADIVAATFNLPSPMIIPNDGNTYYMTLGNIVTGGSSPYDGDIYINAVIRGSSNCGCATYDSAGTNSGVLFTATLIYA